MYIIDVRASHYKINPPLLLTVSGYKFTISQKKTFISVTKYSRN